MRTVDIVCKPNALINRELSLFNLYLKLSGWCFRHHLNSRALFLHYQVQGDVIQMMSVLELMKHADKIAVADISITPNKDNRTLEEIYEQIQRNYEIRKNALEEWIFEAERINDGEMLIFLRELEEMQQEECALINTLLDDVKNTCDLGRCKKRAEENLTPLAAIN